MTFISSQQFNNVQSPTVLLLLRNINAVHEDLSCIEVLDLFSQNSAIFALAIVNDKNVPVGIIHRHAFLESFLDPHQREQCHSKKISKCLMGTPIVVDINSSIDDVSEIIIAVGLKQFVTGFIITENGYYAGVASSNDLLYEIMKRKQENLFYLAHFDQLTKLPNRLLFMDRMSMSIIEAKRNKSTVGLLFINLDNFKNYNDSMGHGFGDQILVAFAERLKNCARANDTVARLSGDEFTILLDNISRQEDMDMLCKRIIEAMKLPWVIMGRKVYLTASIGSAMYPHEALDANELLLKADAAMYEAKRSGRNSFKRFTKGIRIYSLDKMNIETDLRLAIEHDEFELYYQPQIEVTSGKLVGMEALIRWNHPQRGIITPLHFIETAEKSGLIIDIGKWVIDEACRQYQAWERDGFESVCISVNIAPLQFYQVDFCESIRKALNDAGMQPSSLELELTEGTFFHNLEKAVEVLTQLHDLGVKLAIDDFGTGYSNLGYLKRFPIDRVKIDQSFVRGIENEPMNLEIIRSIAALSNIMSLELVAEGVETEVEKDMVSLLNCKIVQGYLYSKPLPAIKFQQWRTGYNLMIINSGSNVDLKN